MGEWEEEQEEIRKSSRWRKRRLFPGRPGGETNLKMLNPNDGHEAYCVLAGITAGLFV